MSKRERMPGEEPFVLVTVALPRTAARVHGAWVAHLRNGGPEYIVSHRIGFCLPNRFEHLADAEEVARQLRPYAREVGSLRQWKALPKATRARIRAAVIRAGGGGDS